MKAIYVILLVSILLFSCNKESGTTTVEGTVLDVTTNKPVPNAVVTLGSREKGSWSAGYAPKDEYHADANGRFAFSFEAQSVASYGLNAGYKKLYFGADSHVPIEGGRKNKDLQVKIQPIGWLKFHLHDELPIGDATSFYIQGFTLPSSVRISWPKDTSFTTISFGNQKTTLQYLLTIKNKDILFTDTVFCNALDTTNVYIKF